MALLDEARAAGVRDRVVLADAGFGNVTAFRDGLTARGLPYVVRVSETVVVWPPDTRFAVPPRSAKGRPTSVERARDSATPLTLGALAATLRHRRVT